MMDAPGAVIERARAVLRSEGLAVAEVADQIGESFVAAVDMILASTGIVFVSGVGTSHAVALRLSHLLSCCGTRSVFLHPADAGHGGSGAVGDADVVVVISKGGESAEANAFADIVRARGARLVVLTERPSSTLASKADLVLDVRPAADVDPFGMIATGSSLVYSAVGDAMCVVLLEKRAYSAEEFGRTHPGGAVGGRVAATQGTATVVRGLVDDKTTSRGELARDVDR